MKNVLYLLSGVAGVGWLLILLAQVAALLGRAGPLADRAEILFVGPFVVGLPTALAGAFLSKDMPQRDAVTGKRYSGTDSWKATLRGCPEWMKYLFYGSVVYGVINLVFVALGHRGLIRFSGGVMAFYAVEVAILYSAGKVWEPGRCCPEGHPVGPLAKFCDQCGRPILDLEHSPALH